MEVLPADVISNLVRYVDRDELFALRGTCKTLKSVVDESDLFGAEMHMVIADIVQKIEVTIIWENKRRRTMLIKDVCKHKTNDLDFVLSWVRVMSIEIKGPTEYHTAYKAISLILNSLESVRRPRLEEMQISGDIYIDVPMLPRFIRRINQSPLKFTVQRFELSQKGNNGTADLEDGTVNFGDKFKDIALYVCPGKLYPFDAFDFQQSAVRLIQVVWRHPADQEDDSRTMKTMWAMMEKLIRFLSQITAPKREIKYEGPSRSNPFSISTENLDSNRLPWWAERLLTDTGKTTLRLAEGKIDNHRYIFERIEIMPSDGSSVEIFCPSLLKQWNY